MGEIKINPILNVHENYTRVNIVNPYRFGGVASLIDQPNLLTFPNEYENAYWTKNNASIVSTNVLAPDGTNTARNVSVNANALGLYRLVKVNVSLNQSMRVSVWLKASTATDVIIGFNGETKGVNNRATIVSVGTSWAKYTYTELVKDSDTGIFASIASTQWSNNGNSGTTVPLNVGGSRVLDIWGASFNVT